MPRKDAKTQRENGDVAAEVMALCSWGSSALTGILLVSGACLTLLFFATLRLCVRMSLSRKGAKTQREKGDVVTEFME